MYVENPLGWMHFEESQALSCVSSNKTKYSANCCCKNQAINSFLIGASRTEITWQTSTIFEPRLTGDERVRKVIFKIDDNLIGQLAPDVANLAR
uniref:Uncharacterized protein n=1 Tax=Romanomermis culicivorax TaxID=13658 RepID=A0A915IFI5_ROMCU